MHSRCSPGTANAGVVIDDCEVNDGIDLEVGLCGGEARPACTNDYNLFLFHLSHRYRRRQKRMRMSGKT